MRKVSFTRHLKPSEVTLARLVFHDALPYSQIGITDGLGKDDTVWTHDRSLIPFSSFVTSSFQYYVNFGDGANADLSVPGVPLRTLVPGYDRSEMVSNVFIHELTHVWQYSQPYADPNEIALRCVYAQSRFGAGYGFTPGDPWSAYNFEQQASIVETWNKGDRKETDVLFPYIHYIIRKEGLYSYNPTPGDRTEQGLVYSDYWFANIADLAQLQVLLDGERMPVPIDEPVRITPKDDSFVVVLTGDVLFDFNKSNLKSTADGPLEQAWNKIKSNSRRKAVFINGHTDRTGEDGYNLTLSQKRAQSVAQWFVNHGYLTQAMIRTQGFGKSQPVAPNTTAANRAKNRRVEIYLRNS